MNAMMCAKTIKAVTEARAVADYTLSLGLLSLPYLSRTSTGHLGAALADAILQAGVNYETVVRRRVNRIMALFPETAVMRGISTIIFEDKTAEFLQWNHETKLVRFVRLATFLDRESVCDVETLRVWLSLPASKNALMRINGVGPKTYDYLSCLVGHDRIAVDRHVITFVSNAGVRVADYDSVQRVVSFAADLLQIRRRDFDTLIWRHISSAGRPSPIDAQFALPFSSDPLRVDVRVAGF